jgi:phosphoglucomutase
MIISPLAGKPTKPEMLVDVPKLVTAYYAETPDPSDPARMLVVGDKGLLENTMPPL